MRRAKRAQCEVTRTDRVGADALLHESVCCCVKFKNKARTHPQISQAAAPLKVTHHLPI